MPIVANILTADGVTLYFDKFLTPDGRVLDFPKVIEEELIANGVDGRRFRLNAFRYQPFTAQTLETASTYADAITRCRFYDAMIGDSVRLTITNLAGGVYTYKRVHVISCNAVPVPGYVAGAAVATNAAHITATMEMVVMEQDDGANP